MKRTRIRQVSARRRKRDANYPAARRAVYARAMGMCEIEATYLCERYGSQAHHIAGRTGDDPHRLDNLLWTCHVCHQHVHQNPQDAYDNGWMVRRNRGAA